MNAASSAPSTLDQGAGNLRGAIALLLFALLGTGLAYSLAATGIARMLFPQQATGSVIERDGKVTGSALVAQPFADPRYFQPRPSAAGYDPMAAAGSNQARSNPALRERIEQTRQQVAARDGVEPASVPDDLITQSGSGLDPHISAAGAQVQIARIARVRGLPPQAVAELVGRQTKAPQFGLLGEPRVNVLELNLALDALR